MRKRFLLNLLLGVSILFMAFNLNQLWDSSSQDRFQEASSPQAEQVKANKTELKKESKAVPALPSYNVIGKRNLFRPQRKEWVPPPPPPKPEPKKEPPKPPPPPPDPLPAPTLWGIVIEENEKIALMQGHKRIDITPPQRSGRRRRYAMAKRYRFQEEPMGRYRVGDNISEFKIIKILSERVVLERDGQISQVMLRSPKKSKGRPSRPSRRSRLPRTKTPRRRSSPFR